MRPQFLSEQRSLQPYSANKATSPKFKDLIKKVVPEALLTSLNLTFKYRKNKWVLPEVRDAKGLRLLFVHSSGIHLEPVVQAFLKAGADVFVCNGSYFYQMNAILGLGKPVMNLARTLTSQASRLEREFCTLAQNFLNEGQDWLPWIDQKAGVPMKELVAPFFESFFKETCPQILIKAESFQNFYERFQIDFMVTHTSADSFAKSALVAAALHPSVKSVCIQHCCDVFEDKVMEMTDIDPFDVHFATDSLSQIRFRQYAQKDYVKPAQVFQSPHFLINVAAYAKKGTAPARKKRVLYLPTKLTVHTRYFNCLVYPITWYFEYQKELLNFFSRQDFQFIYKHQVRNKKYTENSLIPYIEARGYKNIKVETAPMMTYFQSVDAIIMDRPTTALYEAAMSGVPTLALYPDMIDGLISKEAVDFFGKGVQRFSSHQEAFEKIEEFLNSRPEDYRAKVPLRDEGIVKTLILLRHVKKGSDAKTYFLKATV